MRHAVCRIPVRYLGADRSPPLMCPRIAQSVEHVWQSASAAEICGQVGFLRERILVFRVPRVTSGST